MYKNKKLFLFLVLIFTIYMLMPLVSANNDTIYVAPDAGSDGDGSIANPYNSISKALDDVGGEKNTIVLENGTYSEININIIKSVNMIGWDGAVLDGINRGPIFKISNTSTVHLTNLTFKNSFTNAIGSAIVNSGNLYVDNVKFLNNCARFAPAIDNGGSLFVTNSYFEANYAFSGDGGAIGNTGNLTVINSVFINNTALRNGGAIKHQGNKFKVINSTFIGNDAYGWDNYGGAVYIWASKAEIHNSTFKSNWGGYGGAVFIGGGNLESTVLTVSQCIFEDNHAKDGIDLEIDDGVANVNYSKILGGVSVLKTSEVNLDYNWWGVNTPDFSGIMTSPKPDIYAVLNLTNNKTTVKTGVYWVNSSQVVNEIPQLIGSIQIDSREIDNLEFIREYEFSVSKNSNVTVVLDNEVLNLSTKIKTYLMVDSLEMYYHDGSHFVAYLKDFDDNNLANQSIEFEINGMKYNRTTDDAGCASIGLNLISGLYNVGVNYNPQLEIYSGCNATANVNILPTVNGSDVVKVYRTDTQYFATFLDFNGKYLASGTVVSFNINGIFYNRTVGEKGLAKLNINLNPKEYIITTINTVTGEELSNKITVLSRFSENTDVVKYYKNATQYTVKIIGDDGKAAGAGEDVTFNINGIFYTRQTDENGIAKLSINLPPGNYVITAEYKGCKVSNDIKVLPVLYATDIKMKYHDGTHFVSTLVDGHGRPFANQFVTFNINGVFYSKITDNSGQAKLKINLLAGKYIITSSYNGSNIANTITITA